MKVVITKELDESWGIKELLEDLPPNASVQEKGQAIIELLLEDIAALLESPVSWRIIE